jgi:PTH1 family peptidyl-tRNA hydrolase
VKLIVGLGNPGLFYAGSRHNIGAAVLKSLARTLKISFKRDSSVFALVGSAKVKQQNIVLILPQTYMNLSGKAVSACLKKFKSQPADLLVICDDLDLELGRIKLRACGSSGGQRGLASIIESLGTNDFSRLRVGIDRPKGAQDPADYVLSGFLRSQKKIVEEAKEEAVSCCVSWMEKGVVETMNIFNIRSRNE